MEKPVVKLLLINANTTVGVTERLVEHARTLAGPEVEVVGATGRFGARYISSRAAVAVAAHAALDALAEHGEDADAVCLACFGDPGLAALKEIIELDPAARVIMCSALGQESKVLESIKLGAKDFVVKPFQADRVLDAVGKALG